MFTPEQLEERPQDMRLRLNTPQLNRLKYLVGRELDKYVPSDRLPEYDGEEPYLIVSKPPRYDDDGPITEDNVLRSADQLEFDTVQDLRDQLENLWSSASARQKHFSQTLAPTPYVYGGITESV